MKKLIFYSIIFKFLIVIMANQAVANDNYAPNCFYVTGHYSSEGVSEEFARSMAIRDALKNASMQNNLKISSSFEINNFALTKDTTRFTTQSKVSSFTIKEQGFKKTAFEDTFDSAGMPKQNTAQNTATAIYQVTLNACLTQNPETCENLLGNHLQPKVVVAQALLTDEYGARDIYNLRLGYQLALKRNLHNKGHINLDLLHTGTRLQDRELILSPNLSAEILDPIRDKTGAQYLVLSVINSVERNNTTNRLWRDVKRFYNQESKYNARSLEVTTFIVNLIERQVVHQQTNSISIQGDVSVGHKHAFGTKAFFATETGLAFNSLLAQISTDIQQFLKCQPLKTNIIDIRGNEYILFLSAQSGAKVGDEFSIYHKFGRPIMSGGINLGLDSKPVGFLKITRIQSRFAVAKVTSKNGLIQVGDKVLSW